VSRAVVAVAVSGGPDSTALWHATARAARGTGLRVIGLHVHHGLLPQADGWLAHLRQQARRWAAAGLPVALDWRHLDGAPARGDSIEAWARRGRHAALADMAQAHGASLLLLAHHRRDQAETFLLQALRGAGPAGLSAMPLAQPRGGLVWARPWLAQPAEAITAYVRRHRLRCVQDPSNADPRFARSRLRHGPWAALEAAFPDAQATLSAATRRAQEAASCLQALAALDLPACLAPDGSLRRAPWLALSAARRANLLRAWLAGDAGLPVPDSLVQRLLAELPRAAAGSAWPGPGGLLRLHAGALHTLPPETPAPVPPERLAIDLRRPGRHPVPPWGGHFVVTSVAQGGLAPELLRQAELRPRRGGERFQAAPGSLPRSLKLQFQAAGVPAWQRGGPLLFAGERLLFVPGLGLDARCLAPAGSPMRGLRWQAGAADPAG